MTDLMTKTPIAELPTPRLDLIAITPEMIRCERDGLAAKDGKAEGRHRFESLLQATIPKQWPPQDWEPHVLDFLLKQMTEFPESIGWTRFVVLRAATPDKRILIGTVGAVLPGSEMAQAVPGEIEVGYGILPAFQRQGYATEALAALMEWVRRQANVSAFVAQTFPRLLPSIRVLEKSGFELAGDGFEAGTILFRRKLRQECETIIPVGHS